MSTIAVSCIIYLSCCIHLYSFIDDLDNEREAGSVCLTSESTFFVLVFGAVSKKPTLLRPQKMRRFSHKGIFPTNLTNHGVRRPHLSGSPSPPTQYFHTSPPGGNDSAWAIDEFESRKSDVSALLLTRWRQWPAGLFWSHFC